MSGANKELTEIRREVIESRNLVIKTDNLLKSLHAELKAVGKRQEEFRGRQVLSSIGAYALFVVLCVAGAWLVSSARVSATEASAERLEGQLAAARAEVESVREANAAREAAAKKAADVHAMLVELPGEERLEGVRALGELDGSLLSPLERTALETRAEAVRDEIGGAIFESGKRAFRQNDMETTARELERFVTLEPSAADLLDASFFLGIAYNQLERHEEAVPLLQRFIEGDRTSSSRDYAMLMLAQSHDRLGQYAQAVEVAKAALADHPGSRFTRHLNGRVSASARKMAE